MSEFARTAYFLCLQWKEVITISKQYKTITYEDRKKIEQLLNSGLKVDEIAQCIGVHKTTLYRELRVRKDQNGEYHADYAQKTIFFNK